MKTKLFAPVLAALLSTSALFPNLSDAQAATIASADVSTAFSKQGIRLSPKELATIQDNVELAVSEAREHGEGNSKVDFAAVEIAQELGLDTGPGSNTVQNVVAALKYLTAHASSPRPVTRPLPPPSLSWNKYFDKTLSLNSDQKFLSLLETKRFFPVTISWEDIGRDEGSSMGDRISDVGIWVRRKENDRKSAQLALSVRRDSNFRDKVLMVPADKIKIHLKEGNRTVERTLPQRLAELGLTSKHRDKNVIVSNQFAVVPVPAKEMKEAARRGQPPRVAFNFSIYPYGSTNFVITDVIEGSSDAIVGPGQHQMLYSNVHGKKAPFTASRAEDRPDLLKLEADLKAQGMDVDVQRYYLIQVPLKRDVRGLQLSNMGTPPSPDYSGISADGMAVTGSSASLGSMGSGPGKGGMATTATVTKAAKAKDMSAGYPSAPPPPKAPMPAPTNEMQAPAASAAQPSMEQKRRVTAGDDREEEAAAPGAGLTKVAIGHGDTEGSYRTGSGYRGARAEEPIRVTVVYFVTPVGAVTQADMEHFTKAFSAWDGQAIWGGSFVTKETN